MCILILIALKNKRRRSTFTSHNKDEDNQARATTPEQANHKKDTTLKQTSGICILHVLVALKNEKGIDFQLSHQ